KAGGPGGAVGSAGAGVKPPKSKRHSPAAIHAVGIERGVAAHQRNALGQGLGRQQPVERIAVMERQVSTTVAWSRAIGSKSKLLFAKAISQQLAMLTNLWLAGSSISARADRLSRESFHRNQ